MELAEDEQSDDSTIENEDVDSNLQCYIQKMNDFRDELSEKSKNKIVDAQMKQKHDYDRKHGKRKVQTKGCGESISYYLIAILVFQLYMFEFNIFTGAGTRSIGSAT